MGTSGVWLWLPWSSSGVSHSPAFLLFHAAENKGEPQAPAKHFTVYNLHFLSFCILSGPGFEQPKRKTVGRVRESAYQLSLGRKVVVVAVAVQGWGSIALRWGDSRERERTPQRKLGRVFWAKTL